MATGFLDLIRIATAELVKVGPKGYIHGWIHVGVPGVGDHVFHPRHGDGKVTHLDEHGHVHVTFAGGKSRSFAHTTGASGGLGRRSDHFKTGDKFSEHLRAAGAANRRGDHTAAADHYRQAADAATHPKIKAEMLARAERDAGKTPGNPTVEKPPVPVAPKSKYDEHMAAARDAAKRGDIPTAVRHYQEAGVHAPSKIHRNVAVRERTALDNTGTPKTLTADEHDAEAARHNAAAADLEAKAKNLPAGVGNANGAGQRGRAQAAMAADARAHRQEADRHTAAALALRPKPTGGASGGKTKPGSDKTQFQVTMPDGTVETRNSEHPYTHAVVVPHDNHAQAAALERSADRRERNIKDKPDLYPPDVATAHRRAADKERAQAADLRAKPQTGHHVYRWSASPKGAEAGVKEYRKNGGTGTPQIVQVGTDMSKPTGGLPGGSAQKPDPNAPSPDQVVPGGTHVRDLKDGQYARLIGTDQYGQHTVLEGYVSTPTAFRVGPKRGKKKDMLGVWMSETPSGHGANWRGQVFVPPTALTEKPTFGGKPAVPEDTGWVELPKPVKDVTPPSTPPQPLPEAMAVRGSLDEQKAARDMNRARDRIYDAQKAGDKAAETKAHAKYAEAKTRHDAANAATRADSETRHAGDLHRERVEGDAERAVMAGDHDSAAAKYRELAQSIRDDKGGYNVHRNTSAVNGRQWAVQHSDPNRRVSDGIFTGFKSRESAENAAGVMAEARAKEAERLATINDHAAVSGNGEAARLRVSGNRKLGMVDMYTAERNGRDSHPIPGAMTDEELKNATHASDLVLMNRNSTIDRALSDKIRGHLDAEAIRRGLPQNSVTQRLSEESAKRRAEREATPVPAAGHPLAAAINHDHQAEEHRLNAQTLRARGDKLNAKTDPGGVKRADLNAKAEHHWAQARTESDAAQTIRQNATDPDHRMTLGQLDQHADRAIKEGRNHDAARMFAATADRMRAGEKFTSLNRGYTSGWKVSDPDRTSAGEFGARKDAEAHRERREAEILAVRDRMAKDYAARGHAAKPYNARQQDSVETARRRSGNPHLLIGSHEKLSQEDFHGLIPEHQQKVTEHVEGLGQRSPGEVHNRAQALLDRWNGKPAEVEKPKPPEAAGHPMDRFTAHEQAQIRNAVHDKAGDYVHLGRGSVPRYTSEGALSKLTDKHGLNAVSAAVSSVIGDHPGILDRDKATRDAERDARKKAAEDAYQAAAAAYDKGDAATALRHLDEGEKIDATHAPGGNGTWGDVRSYIKENPPKPKDADQQERGVRRQAHLDAAHTALGNGDRAGASKEYDAAHLLSDSFGDRDAVRDDQVARMGLAMHPAAATQYLNHVTAHEMDGHPDKAAVEQLSRDISAGKTTPDEARKTIRGMTDRHLPGSKEAITLGHVHDGLITGESRDSRSMFQTRNDAMINRRRAQAGLDRLPEHEYTGAPGVVPGATDAKPTGGLNFNDSGIQVAGPGGVQGGAANLEAGRKALAEGRTDDAHSHFGAAHHAAADDATRAIIRDDQRKAIDAEHARQDEHAKAEAARMAAMHAANARRNTPVSKVDEHLAAADAKLRAGDRVGALNHLNIAAGHEKDAKARQVIIERQKTLGAELMGKKPAAEPAAYESHADRAQRGRDMTQGMTEAQRRAVTAATDTDVTGRVHPAERVRRYQELDVNQFGKLPPEHQESIRNDLREIANSGATTTIRSNRTSMGTTIRGATANHVGDAKRRLDDFRAENLPGENETASFRRYWANRPGGDTFTGPARRVQREHGGELATSGDLKRGDRVLVPVGSSSHQEYTVEKTTPQGKIRTDRGQLIDPKGPVVRVSEFPSAKAGPPGPKADGHAGLPAVAAPAAPAVAQTRETPPVVTATMERLAARQAEDALAAEERRADAADNDAVSARMRAKLSGPNSMDSTEAERNAVRIARQTLAIPGQAKVKELPTGQQQAARDVTDTAAEVAQHEHKVTALQQQMDIIAHELATGDMRPKTRERLQGLQQTGETRINEHLGQLADAARRHDEARREWGAVRPVAPVGEMTDAQLADRFHELSGSGAPDPVKLAEVGDEMDRRHAAVTAVQDRIDTAVAKGVPYMDAYAEAHGLDPAKLGDQHRAAIVDSARRAGETRDQTVRRMYAEHVHLQHLAAERATNGHLLTPKSRAAGVDPVTLFSGPSDRARVHASEDLQRWWADHPRSTYAEFKAQMLGDSGARRAAGQNRLRANGRDFGV